MATRGKRHALIVSADTYGDSKLSRLRSPAVEADALRRVLQDPDVGAFDRVDVSINEPNHLVRRTIEAFFKDRSTDDLLVLHFGCHGIKDDDGALYFASADTEFTQLESTAISAEFVNKLMARSRSRRIVLLLDCCYSGAFATGGLPRAATTVDLKERFEQGHGRAVLTASTAMEYSWEGDQLKNEDTTGPSSFTAALIHGLETGEANRDQDEWVSLTELSDYVADYVKSRNPKQTPQKWFFGIEGDIYIARMPPGARRARGAGRRLTYVPRVQLNAGAEVFSVAISADNRTIAAGSVGVILIWHGDTDIASWTAPPEPTRLRKIHKRFVYSVAFSRDGRRLATGGEDGIVHVMKVGGDTIWRKDDLHGEAVYSVAFSPDGTSLASGGYDRKALIIDAATGTRLQQKQRAGRVSSVAYAPDKEVLAIGSLDNTVTLYDVVTDQETPLPDSHASSVEQVVFSRNGTRLASCGLDKAVRVWDITGTPRRLWSNSVQHEYLVRGIAFSPDGTTLASASWDKTVRIWNVETGKPTELVWQKNRLRHTDWIWSVAFSPDGRVLASGGSDGTIILWALADA